jgi:DNA-binding transcriptional LysR family regulator
MVLMDELRDVVPFVEVARTRSFTRAAKKLDMPASTLSRRISELEKSVGSKLFGRTTRRVELTEAGRIYFARCVQIVDDAQAAREELSAFSHQPRGSLRVTMSPTFGNAFLAPIVADFARLYPEISLQLDLSPRHVDLLAEDFDLAIRAGVARLDPSLVARRLMLGRRALYAAPSLLKSFAEPTAPAGLSSLPFLTVDRSDANTTLVLHRGRETVQVSTGGRITANNPQMLLQLAIEGAGVVGAGETMASSFVRTGALKRILNQWELAPIEVHAVTASRTLPLKVRLFVDHLQQKLKKFDAAM